MYSIGKLLLLLQTIVLFAVFSPGGVSAAQPPVVLLVDSLKSQTVYYLDGRQVSNKSLLELFGDKVKQNRHAPVVVLMHENTSLATISHIHGVISKAGLNKIRFFHFSSDRERMAEIVIDRPAVPFSTNPK